MTSDKNPSSTDPPLVIASETPPIALAPTTAETETRGYVEMGYLFAAAGALLFSTKAIAIKLAYQEAIDAETLLALRMAMAIPFYAAIAALAIRDRRHRGEALPTASLVLKSALVGALGYWVASYADFLGLEYISASFERLILFTYPFFVVVFGALFFGQPIQLRVLLAVSLSYVGLALIFTEKAAAEANNTVIGASLVLVAAVAFAFYQLFAKGLIAQVGPRLFTCIAMAGAAVGAFVQFFLTHPASDLIVSERVYFVSLYLAIGATVLPSFFINAALHRIPAQANATIGTLSPVATILLAVVILGERLTLADVFGTALVLCGVGWFTLAGRSAPK
jgi:drug/metabolite transporter (DMT)-like permease